jgi:hypothetical protein
MLTAIASSLPAQQATPRYYDVREDSREADNAPQIDLWLDQVSYRYGDRITPYFDTEPGAYVTVVRVTTDGQLTVLYPRRPREQEPYEPAQLINNRVPYTTFDGRFNVNESDGIGFVFAVASYNKFNYAYFSQGGGWNIGRLAYEGGVGDPFEILRRFVDRTLGEGADFSMDYVSYRVTDNGARTRYSTRYAYNDYNDYYDSCLSAFGWRYTSYCRNAYPGYYGPYIVSQPGNPTPNTPSTGRNLKGKKLKPVTGDPIVAGAPEGPQVQTEGRLPTRNPGEAAAEASQRARMRRELTPRDRTPSQVETPPVYRAMPVEQPQRAEPAQRPEPAPRSDPEPRQFQPPVVRAEPRVEPQRYEPPPPPRVEPQRYEPPAPRVEVQRYEPPPPPRVEVRNDPPPPAPQPAPVAQPAPRPTATPATKDNKDQN